MCFIETNGKDYYKAERPFMWKSVGGSEYLSNGLDDTISHIFHRIIAEMNYSKANNETTENINIFAYSRNPGPNWKHLDLLRQFGEIDIIFTPNIDSKEKWKNLSVSEENKIKDKMLKDVPFCKNKANIWKNNPTWKNISPEIEQLVGQKNCIPDTWWIYGEQGNNNYCGFVIKDLEYFAKNDNKYINFHRYATYISDDAIGSSTSFSLLNRSENSNIKKLGTVPIVAKAKLIAPYIVSIKK